MCLVLCLGGEKEEGDDGQDLRRTESDSGLKKVWFSRETLRPMNLWAPPFSSLSLEIFSLDLLNEILSSRENTFLEQTNTVERPKLLALWASFPFYRSNSTLPWQDQFH